MTSQSSREINVQQRAAERSSKKSGGAPRRNGDVRAHLVEAFDMTTPQLSSHNLKASPRAPHMRGHHF